MKFIYFLLGIAAMIFQFGCISGRSTEDIPAVTDFEIKKYLGKWYEIARLPHSFERGLDGVSAEYTLNDDGSVRVVNTGFKNGEKKEAVGRAVMKGADNVGELQVSFFRPFYGDYRIIELASDYEYAIVTGSTYDYFWILARKKELAPELKNRLVERAAKLGFDTSRFEYPKQ